MKQTISLILALLVAVLAFAGCGAAAVDTNLSTSSTASNVKTENASYVGAEAIALADEKSKTITQGGSYTISGKLSDGQLIIDTTQNVYLELAGVTISNKSGAAIVVNNAKEVTITLKEGSENVLTDGGASDYNAAIFSNDTLILEGDGNLTINGNQGHGIESDDDIIVNGGVIAITALTDAIHANNNVTINGGSVTVLSAYEGIESKADLIINGGMLSLLCSDDGLNAATGITINGGNIYTKSTKGDAIDSNGVINMSGGTVVAVGSQQAEGGIDCDQHSLNITGGTLIATGGTNSPPTAASSTQASVLLSGVAADTILHLNAASGDILTFKSEVACQSVVFSSPLLEVGKEYTIYTGGSVSGGSDFHGLYSDASYSNGTKGESFTTQAMVTIQGGNTGMGGGGHMGGGKNPNGDFAKGEMPEGGFQKGERPTGEPPTGELPTGELPQLPENSTTVSEPTTTTV